VNRMSFQPQPLYQLGPWAQQHGIHRMLNLDPAWLDDDRLGAMLEALADQQVSIWGALSKGAVKKFQVPLDWLHADTTSIYFEGSYQDQDGNPKGGGERVPRLVEGYNKDGQRHKAQLVLSLTTSGRVPVWYKPWDGNQADGGVYLADLQDLRRNLLAPENAVLIGDRKLCNRATLLAFYRQGQQFLAAHPWTPTAKKVWLETLQRLEAGELGWQEVE
jgi:transposase